MPFPLYDPFLYGNQNNGGAFEYLGAVAQFAGAIQSLYGQNNSTGQQFFAPQNNFNFWNNGSLESALYQFSRPNDLYAINGSSAWSPYGNNSGNNYGNLYWNNSGSNMNSNAAYQAAYQEALSRSGTTPQQNNSAPVKQNTDNYMVSVRRDVTGIQNTNLLAYDSNNNKSLDDNELQSLFSTFDLNNDGLLNVVEYNEAATYAGVATNFSTADKNQDKAINVQELDKLLPSDLSKKQEAKFAQVTETAPLAYKDMPETVGMIDKQQRSYNDVLAAKAKADAAIANLESARKKLQEFQIAHNFSATTPELQAEQKELEDQVDLIENGGREVESVTFDPETYEETVVYKDEEIIGSKQLVAEFEAADKAFKGLASTDLKGSIAVDMRNAQGAIAARVEEQRMRANAQDALKELLAAEENYKQANEKLSKLQEKYPENEPKGLLKIQDAKNAIAAAARDLSSAVDKAGNTSKTLDEYTKALEAKIRAISLTEAAETSAVKQAALQKNIELLNADKAYIDERNEILTEHLSAIEVTHASL